MLRKILCAAACAAALALAQAAPASTAAAVLPTQVQAALQRAKLPRDAMVAVVQEVGASSSRLAWQPDRVVHPASLMKLVTTQAALELLGPAWHWSTPVWLDGAVRADGVLDGNLVIRGSGDPQLVLERVWQMLRRVKQLGVHEIHGDIVLDRSAFAVPERSAGEFDGDADRPYNVQPDALLLNFRSLILNFRPDAQQHLALVSASPTLDGVRVDASVPLSDGACIGWRDALKADTTDPSRIRFAGAFPAACGEQQWPMAYADPKHFDEKLLLGLWREMGGTLSGTVREGAAPATPPTFVVDSPPLPEVIRDINKFSNNMMAQQLFLTLGLTQRGAGSWEAARDAVLDWSTRRLGPQASRDLVIANGSGLSRDAQLSAGFLAQLLQTAWQSPTMPELMSSLPISGIDGTLRHAGAGIGRAHLKSGSLRDVAGLAGYVLSCSGQRYVVVAIINHPNANAGRAAIDALVQWSIDDDHCAARQQH